MNENAISSDISPQSKDNEGDLAQADDKAKSKAPQNPVASHKWEAILGELVHFIGLFIGHSKQAKGVRTTEVLFDHLIRHLEILTRMPGYDNAILIRRTDCQMPLSSSNTDYTVICGNLMVKTGQKSASGDDTAPKTSKYMENALIQAFQCFSDHGIHSLFIKIPKDSPKDVDQLRLALNIVARFQDAVNEGSSIRFHCYGRALTFSIIHDAQGRPDPNLTMTASLNGLSPINAREMIKQAEAFHKMGSSQNKDEEPEEISSYNQIFSVRSLRSQIIKPPVEVNNLPWLKLDSMPSDPAICQLNAIKEKSAFEVSAPESRQQVEPDMDSSDETLNNHEPGSIRRMISKYIDIEEKKNKAAIDAMMAEDYKELNPIDIGGRIVSVTKLLYALDKKCQDPAVTNNIVHFFQGRLSAVEDAVLASIIAQRQGLKIIHNDRTVMVGLVHPRVFDLITLVSEHVVAKRRIAIVKDIAFNFDLCHVGSLADGFGISELESHQLLKTLDGCFSSKGSFIRPTFEERITQITQYENIIFEILWCFLKETPRRQDRLDFLNAFQLLMAKLSSPKRAAQFLLADICQSTSEIQFTDRNAFSLANILLHLENKELHVDISRTPENVLFRQRDLNSEVRQYAVWRLEVDSIRMLAKLRGIHDTLEETLDIPPGESGSFQASFLFALEREALIFLAIVGGHTARIFLREALARYGSADSEVYRYATSKKHLSDIMAQLQIVVRSLGCAGNIQDIETIKELKSEIKRLYELDQHPAHALRIKQLMKWIPETLKMIHSKG